MKARRAESIDFAKQVGKQGAAAVGWLTLAAGMVGVLILLALAAQ